MRSRTRCALSLSAGHRAILAMGRCAAGLATIPVVAERHPDACVVWFDAHGDSNLPNSNAVPYLGGMVLTGAAGHWDSGLGAGLNLVERGAGGRARPRPA